MILRHKGDKRKFEFLSRECLGRPCFAPGTYQHRGATSSGSRNTGAYSDCCMNRAYRGCPNELPEPNKELMADLKRDGCK
jgi:hypothetical protein